MYLISLLVLRSILAFELERISSYRRSKSKPPMSLVYFTSFGYFDNYMDLNRFDGTCAVLSINGQPTYCRWSMSYPQDWSPAQQIQIQSASSFNFSPLTTILLNYAQSHNNNLHLTPTISTQQFSQ